MSKKTGGPAFPWDEKNGDGTHYHSNSGMSLRSYAAIHLRQPDSEHEWLNEMIRKAQRDELAARAMQGIVSMGPERDDGSKVKIPTDAGLIASASQGLTDAMLAAREGQ